MFSEDEELIQEKIIDYHDYGIDCYVWHEDLHDLYLIQNKFYSDDTKISTDYIQNDFLCRALTMLRNGTYDHCKELQNIYNRYSLEEDFCVHFHLYVSNNAAKTQRVIDCISEFNQKHASEGVDAHFYCLDDIYDLYYKEPISDKKSFAYTMETIKRGTRLNIDSAAYEMTLALDAKYVLTPILVIYEMYTKAARERYQLFDENIREYLGSTGTVNKKIKSTLLNPDDRNNFFFYNNGITIIVEDMSAEYLKASKRCFDISDPQIVNGCQTVSTIFETLSGLP